MIAATATIIRMSFMTISKYDEELEIDNEYFDDDFHESDEEKGDE